MTVRFLLACLLQVAVIAGVAAANLAVLVRGADVMLRIEPVDPRDPIRGDYLTFQYGISNLGMPLFASRRPHPGELVYVVVAPRGKYWEAVRVEFAPPRGEVFLRGRVAMTGWSTAAGRVRVSYGIEQYFVQEGRGRNVDIRNRDVGAQVAVDASGQAVVRRLYVNGRPWP